MKNLHHQWSCKKLARLTGLFYFMIIVCGLYSGLVVRDALVNPQDANETLSLISSNLFQFRLGFAADLLMAICDVIVSVLFFVLLRNVNQIIALLALCFRMIQSCIIGLNLLNLFNPVIMLNSSSAYQSENLAQEILLSINQFEIGYLISGVFFSVNCALMGYLLFKSALFPRSIGVMIGLASLGYFVNCMANFLFPEFIMLSEVLMLVTAVVSELTFCIYLLIKGTK
ncbi:DUF4386 domain-containing protein [bacterium]|nr:DUF4386 domain-containing protein [bacterium]